VLIALYGTVGSGMVGRGLARRGKVWAVYSGLSILRVGFPVAVAAMRRGGVLRGWLRHGVAWFGKGYKVAVCPFNERVFRC